MSCSIQKRQHMPGFHIEWFNKQHNKTTSSKLDLSKSNKKLSSANSIETSNVKEDNSDNTSLIQATNESALATLDNNVINYSTPLLVNTHNPSLEVGILNQNKPGECDIITLKNGEEINAKVTEIGISEIKYKKCDNLNGPVFSISKVEVFMIKYANGTKDIFDTNNNSNQNQNNQNNNQPKVSNSKQVIHWAALTSFICALVGLFLFGVILGLLAIIFGAIALSAIKNNPEKYKGKGFAIAGLIIGIVAIGLWIILLFLLLV